MRFAVNQAITQSVQFIDRNTTAQEETDYLILKGISLHILDSRYQRFPVSGIIASIASTAYIVFTVRIEGERAHLIITIKIALRNAANSFDQHRYRSGSVCTDFTMEIADFSATKVPDNTAYDLSG